MQYSHKRQRVTVQLIAQFIVFAERTMGCLHIQSFFDTILQTLYVRMNRFMPHNQKNAIWILSDQHRAQSLSCNGDPNVRTPNIDTLAATGVNFTSAVSGFPLCCPFRGSMLTGLYPHECVPGHEYPLPEGQQTIAHVFKERGYHTGYFGKWHLSGHKEATGRAVHHIVPPDRRGGFDTWLANDNNNSQWDCWVHGQRDAAPAGADGSNEIPLYCLNGYETDTLTDLFIEYLNKRAEEGQPFFAALSVQPPHPPYSAPPEYVARFSPATVTLRPNVPDVKRIVDRARQNLAGSYAMIENLDHNIGRIVAALKRLGLYKDTHILFFSDHGDMLGSNGQFLKTKPFEESIRIPFIVSGEQPVYDGRKTGRSGAPVNHVDIAPTTLGLCGIDKPDWMRGTDYSSHRLDFRPMDQEPDSAYLQVVVPPMHGNSAGRPWRGLVTRDGWKYACHENMPWILYNLNEDPYEQVNMAHNPEFKAKHTELLNRLKRWAEDTGDSFPFPEEA
jgi:arylsulfatase A-like enzyme